MGTQGRRPGPGILATIAAAVAVAALVALIVQATSTEAPLVDQAETALWWLAAAVLAAALALGAWMLQHRGEAHLRAEERRRRAEAEALREQAAAREDEAERLRREVSARDETIAAREDEVASLRDEVRDRDAKLENAKDRAERWSRRDHHEREVNQRLRREIADMQERDGSLGDWGDIRKLVLHMAMTLVDAEKGILLMRDADGDGEVDRTLEPVEHEGFDGDPARSALAQRFGHEVLERDRIVREDEPEEKPEGDRSPADEEIDNLVAIPIYIRDQFSGVVVCANREGGFSELDDEVLLALGDQAGAALNNQRLHGELRSSYVSTIRVLAEAIQAKDPFLRGHSDEVSEYVAAVAERLDIDGQRREQLIVGSLLHDVGKIGISERILHKPAKLTQEEFAIIQLHPRIGYRLIEQVPALQPVAAAILHHHERYDGGGYPAGLKGEQIPLEARIVCVADAFSAMTADRPYRRRMALDDACEELERHAGTQFDPKIVRVFVEEVRKQPPGEDGTLATALDDAELQVHRNGDAPVLGADALALTDSLTLLYSHRYLHETAFAEAERARLQDRPFAVALACIDEVQTVNARDGYAAGDLHLRAAARGLSQLAVRLGATACREGGLALALLVPGGRVPPDGSLDAQMREALRDHGAVRVGVAVSEPQESGESVIARARSAMRTEDVATQDAPTR